MATIRITGKLTRLGNPSDVVVDYAYGVTIKTYRKRLYKHGEVVHDATAAELTFVEKGWAEYVDEESTAQPDIVPEAPVSAVGVESALQQMQQPSETPPAAHVPPPVAETERPRTLGDTKRLKGRKER